MLLLITVVAHQDAESTTVPGSTPAYLPHHDQNKGGDLSLVKHKIYFLFVTLC